MITSLKPPLNSLTPRPVRLSPSWVSSLLFSVLLFIILVLFVSCVHPNKPYIKQSYMEYDEHQATITLLIENTSLDPYQTYLSVYVIWEILGSEATQKDMASTRLLIMGQTTATVVLTVVNSAINRMDLVYTKAVFISNLLYARNNEPLPGIADMQPLPWEPLI